MMMNFPRRFDREFQVWAYTVGHGQLLLRSNRTAERSTRIDILFKDVGALNMPTILRDLTIAEATAEEFGLNRRIAESRRVFRVSSLDYLGFVVAGAVAMQEDDREYNDPSALCSGRWWPGE